MKDELRDEKFYADDFEEDIYDSEVVDELIESDEITDSEEAFLKGYDEELDHPSKEYEGTRLCPNCGEKIKNDVLICPVCRQDIEKAISF